MKKFISLLLSMAIAVSVMPISSFAAGEEEAVTVSTWDGTTVDTEWTGAGTEGNPYLITSAAELAGLANKSFYAVSTSTDVPVAASETASIYNSYTGKHFKLTADIDLGGNEWLPIGRHGMRFNGIFDGNNHVVKNLKMTTNYFGMGLFGATGSSVVIKNLGIEGANMTFASKGYNGGVFDYNAAGSRTETTDQTWTTANLYRTDRTNGAGTLAGIVEGGTISSCFVRNTKITISGSNIPGSGGLLGFSVTTKVQAGSGVGAYTITVNDTYVYDVELGGESWFPSAFVGSLRPNDSSYMYYSNLTATNCYAAKVNITKYITAANTFVENRGTTWTPKNCYVADITGYTRDVSLAVTDKATIVSGIATVNGWSADNASAPVNDGYPVLAWQNTWSPKPTVTPTPSASATTAPTVTPTTAPTATPVPVLTPDVAWDGQGTEESPYLITSAEELAGLAYKSFYAVSTSTDVPVTVSETASIYNSYTGVYFKLTADIDLENKEWLPIGRHGMRFNGIFDGNNHVVKNLKITTSYFGMGLFGATGSSVVIKNLGIEGANMTFASKGYNGGVFDYNAADSRTETTDKTWTTANLYRTDRTNGAGTLAGIVEGGTISNCFVRNAKITISGSNIPGSGGLLGFSVTTKEQAGSGVGAYTITVNDTYVYDVELGGTSWFPSAFVGALRPNDSSYIYYSNLTATNCYAAKVNITSYITAANTFVENRGTTWTPVNCYISEVTGWSRDKSLSVSNKSTLESALVTEDSAYTFDGTYFGRNGGYPIHKWEAPWLYGTDTDLVSTKLMNMITGSQSPFHIFDNMNFIESAEIDGVSYKFDYWSQYTDLISNRGIVTRTKNIKKNSTVVYIHDTENDVWTKETVDFTVMPRGIGIITDGFDTDLSSWTVSGDVTQSASATGYLLDKMVNVGENGTMSRPFTAYTNGIVNAVLGVYNDSSFDTVTIAIGGAEVEVSKSAFTVNGAENAITVPDGWFDITVTANIDTDEITIKVGENVVTTSFDFTTVDGITIKDGAAKVDNLLVYEAVPGELDELTEELVLNGNASKFDVKSALNLPDKIDFHRGEVDIIWDSSNEDVVKLDGTLGAVELTTKVTLTAKAYNKDSLPDGAAPTEEDILQTKEFEVHVVPVGSTLIFSDDFEGAETEGQQLADYGDWTVNSSGKWVKYSIVRDPAGNPIDSFSDSNKVMLQNQHVAGSSAADVESPTCEFTQTDADVFELSYDIYTTALNHQMLFRIRDGSKNGLITEVYMTNDNGWLSNTVEGGKKRIAFGYKPGSWQNHKYVVNTVDKTISIYVDGVYKQTYRYTGANDTINGVVFGSQRISNPVGMVYIDNVTVRTIMPEDALAVETVKNNLTIADTAEGNIELPTTGKYATDIVWDTTDSDVIDINGTVTRQATEKTVTLTATIIKGEITDTKEFTVTVPATAGTTEATQVLLNSVAKNFLWSEVSDESQFSVTKDVDLVSSYNKGDAKELGGVAVTWTSSDEDVIDTDGNVTRTGADKMVILTATLAKGGISAEKSFKVYVPQTGASETITEDFEGYTVGKDIESESTDWSDAANNGGGHARVMYDGADIDNKILDVKRKTSVASPDMNFKYDVSMESTDILVSMMFKLKSTHDIVKIDIGGTNQRIVITSASVKIGDAALDRTLNLDEWYQVTLYYNTARGTFDAYFDAERFTPVSLKYEGEPKVEGITINDLSADRSDPNWCIDEITVRDIAIADDRAAIEAALSEIDLPVTFDSDNNKYIVEWNIEGLPDAGRYGVAIEWVSERPDVLTSDGVVYRKVGENYTFKFTARASRNGVSIDKNFTVTVPEIPEGYAPTQEVFDKHMSEIPFSRFTDQSVDEIESDINLITYYNEGNASFYGGATIEWSSDKPNVIDSTGKVTRPYFDECVTLTAVYTSRIDPTIKTTVTYKVTVWAEGTVIFREDFENVPAEHEGADIALTDDRFEQEVRPQVKAQFARYRKDVADVALPWADANKVMAIERERGYDVSPERVDFYFPEPITDMDSVAVSFDYMVEDPSVNGTVGFEESIFYPTIQKSVFINKSMRGEAIQAKKWYTFTYVMLKSAGLVIVLRDGERATADYFYQQKGQQLNYMRFDIFRTNPPGKFYIDNIVVRDLSSSDEAAVKEAISALTINDGSVYDNLILENTGINRTIIGYTSSDTDVLANDGTVTRPTDADRNVTLTASVSRGGYIENKVFNLTVKKADAYTTPFVINSINGSGKKFSSVSVTNQTGYSDSANLVVVAYDKSDIVASRVVPLSSISGSGNITFAEIDMSDIEYYSIEAYIVSGNKTVSNKKTVKY